MATITATFTEADVRAAAGERSFRRGQGYLDAVEALATWGNRVAASVRGTDEYHVVLTLSETSGPGGVRGECDCPQGKEGFFCKHCVAVALTILRDAPAQARTGSAETGGPPERAGSAGTGGSAARDGSAGSDSQAKPAGLQAWLNALGRDGLMHLILDQLMEDEEWRRRLELRAATAAADLPAIFARMSDLLDASEFAPYGYVEEGDSGRYGRRLREAAAIVHDLVKAGLAIEATEIAEYALATVASSCRDARDPSGVISDAAAELVAGHRAACVAAPADPVGLAAFLAERTLSPDEIPYIDFGYYVDLLGAAGLAELRDRFTAAWRANPTGWREQNALERLLRAVGDVDELVDVLAAHLDDHGGNHMRIATELDRAGRPDEALAWAERGLHEARHPSDELASYVVERYWSAGRLADALAVRRDRFAESVDLLGFQQLRVAAELAGDWPATRKWALDRLRADASAGRSGSQALRLEPDSVLVDVLIDEGDLVAAWESAKRHASEDQWLRLADLVAETRPADALAVYLRQIEPLRSDTGERAYRRMARLLASARACHHRLGTDRVFNSYLRALRAEQRHKRKLIAILDAQDLREAAAPGRSS